LRTTDAADTTRSGERGHPTDSGLRQGAADAATGERIQAAGAVRTRVRDRSRAAAAPTRSRRNCPRAAVGRDEATAAEKEHQ
jgi:hypothetical protein